MGPRTVGLREEAVSLTDQLGTLGNTRQVVLQPQTGRRGRGGRGPKRRTIAQLRKADGVSDLRAVARR